MSDFLNRVRRTVEAYLSSTAEKGEHLALLRWQLDEGHALESRETYPGHLTTSAIILSPDHTQTLLIAHKTIGRWLQPGGHYEHSPLFWHSALREAEEETGLIRPALHPWHGAQDRPFLQDCPFLIDSHEVPGKASRGEKPHVHHDLQFLLIANPDDPLTAQLDEVDAARWFPANALQDVSPRAWQRLQGIRPV